MALSRSRSGSPQRRSFGAGSGTALGPPLTASFAEAPLVSAAGSRVAAKAAEDAARKRRREGVFSRFIAFLLTTYGRGRRAGRGCIAPEGRKPVAHDASRGACHRNPRLASWATGLRPSGATNRGALVVGVTLSQAAAVGRFPTGSPA